VCGRGCARRDGLAWGECPKEADDWEIGYVCRPRAQCIPGGSPAPLISNGRLVGAPQRSTSTKRRPKKLPDAISNYMNPCPGKSP
jgi:hypothetical protein